MADKKPNEVLQELYESGVELRLEGAKLKVTKPSGSITENEKALIRRYSKFLRQLLKWEEDSSSALMRRAVTLAWQGLQFHGDFVDPQHEDLWDHLESRHDEIEKAFFAEDMGKLRYECTMYVREARAYREANRITA